MHVMRSGSRNLERDDSSHRCDPLCGGKPFGPHGGKRPVESNGRRRRLSELWNEHKRRMKMEDRWLWDERETARARINTEVTESFAKQWCGELGSPK